MKEFNLERALAGDPVITRDGIIPSEIHYFKTLDGQKLMAIINKNQNLFHDNGRQFYHDNESSNDLFMAATKKSAWINIYPSWVSSNLYSCEEKANACRSPDRVACIKVEWEEEIEIHGHT